MSLRSSEGFEAQVLGPDKPHHQRMGAEEACRRLDDETLWIRACHLEFYESYAVVEDPETGKRFLVENSNDEQWATLCKWVATRCGD